MPLFHFAINDGSGLPPLEPVILSSVEVARVQAVRTAAQVFSNMQDRASDTEPLIVTVEDERGLQVCTVTITTEGSGSNVRYLPVRPH